MTLDPETLAAFGKLQRQHMQPNILKMAGWEIETNHGTEYLPDDVVGSDATAESVADFVEGDKVYSIERITGKWFARLSAPGYLDRTDWTVHDSEDEAIAYLVESYA